MTSYLGKFKDAIRMHTMQTIVKPLGVNWVSISFPCFQENLISTEIFCSGEKTRDIPTDDELISIIREVHSLGLRVLLQPSIIETLSGESNHDIDFRNNESAWESWFNSYTQNMLHYARLAQQENVEIISIGGEAPHIAIRTKNWLKLIPQIREVYQGKLTYAAFSYKAEEIQYWDQLDYIGWNVYQGLCAKENQSMDETKAMWKILLVRMGKLSKKWDRKIIISEIGLYPQKNLLCDGWFAPPGPVILDVDYQAQVYQAALESVMDKPFLQGIFWYGLSPNSAKGGMGDLDFTPIGKPAEEVLRKYYGGEPGRTIIAFPEGIADESTPLWMYHQGAPDVNVFPLGSDTSGTLIYDLAYSDPEHGAVIRISPRPEMVGIGFWQRGVDPKNYDWLEFEVRVEGKIEPNLVVYLEEWRPTESPNTLAARSFMTGNLMDENWHLVRIPITALNPGMETIESIVFLTSWPGDPRSATYFLDNIRLVKAVK